VAVDIRRESATFSKQETVELTAENRLALVLPPYVAHGFQTLADDTEAKYQVSGPYKPRDEQGFRWDDPEFNIAWPLPITVISGKDASWPLIAEVSCLSRRDECPTAQHVALPGDCAVGVPNSHISCRPVALRRSAGSC
jgi:dTDP-4-dehydrorhamnose 3,5-epimerase